MLNEQILKEKLYDSLPPVFGRTEVESLIPGLISSKSLANLDCVGQGPNGSFRHGRKVCYERDSFITWLISRIKILSCNKFRI